MKYNINEYNINEFIIFKKINKIFLNILLLLNLKKEVINLYYKNLEYLIDIYKKSLILIIISKILKDKAKN